VQPQIKAANTYEALLVPALFRRWISKVADAAQVQHGQRALDIACGKVYLQGNPPHFFFSVIRKLILLLSLLKANQELYV
jgi:hypothetical protein